MKVTHVVNQMQNILCNYKRKNCKFKCKRYFGIMRKQKELQMYGIVQECFISKLQLLYVLIEKKEDNLDSSVYAAKLLVGPSS